MDIQAYINTLRIESDYALRNADYCNSVHSRSSGWLSFGYYNLYASWRQVLDVLRAECFRVATR